jgi:hypothetical protein
MIRAAILFDMFTSFEPRRHAGAWPTRETSSTSVYNPSPFQPVIVITLGKRRPDGQPHRLGQPDDQHRTSTEASLSATCRENHCGTAAATGCGTNCRALLAADNAADDCAA